MQQAPSLLNYCFKLVTGSFTGDGIIRNRLMLLYTNAIYLPNTQKPTNAYTHTELQIDVELIKEYNEIKYDLVRYRILDIPEFDLEDVDREFIIKGKQRLEEIEREWLKKYNEFMAWKRRKQLLAAWNKL
jgi:hypothetical protein